MWFGLGLEIIAAPQILAKGAKPALQTAEMRYE